MKKVATNMFIVYWLCCCNVVMIIQYYDLTYVHAQFFSFVLFHDVK